MAQIRRKGIMSWLYVPLSMCSRADSAVLYGLLLVVLVLPGLRSISQPLQSKQDVVMQIVIPYESSSETKLQTTHVIEKQTIMHGFEKPYDEMRQLFLIDTWLNFTQTQTPTEILNLFCTEIFVKQVNTMLVFNYGTGVESSNDYIQKLAEHLGYPVISWDPQYPGALEVGTALTANTYTCIRFINFRLWIICD